MTEILLFLCLIQIKHLVIDFLWQPEYEWKNKGTFLHFGGIRHAGKHSITTLIILLMFINPYLAVLLSILEGIIHNFIDWSKMNITRVRELSPIKDAEFWYWLGIDQYFHQLTYILIAWIIF